MTAPTIIKPEWEDATKFLSRVLAWPANPSLPGYGNIHWNTPNKSINAKMPKWWQGKGCKTHIEAVEYIKWVKANVPDAEDFYFCTSMQVDIGVGTNGKKKVRRDKANFLNSKLLFLDVDVKAAPKGYASTAEAAREVARFCAEWALPPPTAMVVSGGGLHCYWISNRALTIDEWQPLADKLKDAATHSGLRCDPISGDAVRVLRVPETQNFKFNPPKKVYLKYLQPQDIDFDLHIAPALAKVPSIAPPPTSTSQPASAQTFFDPSIFKKRTVPAWAREAVGEAQKGLEPEAPPLDDKAILTGCGFLRNSIKQGGAQNDQYLWMLSTLSATFLKNGRAVAHAMSEGWAKGQAAYDPAETNAMYDRKAAEKDKIGWPGCAAIENAGCKDCALCPHRGKIKHPHDLGLQKAAAPALDPRLTTFSNSEELRPGYPNWSEWLPAGEHGTTYAFNEKGVLCKVETAKEKLADGSFEYTPYLLPMMMNQQMLSPWLQSAPDAIHFEIDGTKGEIRQVYIEREYFMSPVETAKILGRQGVALTPTMKLQMGDFLMEFARKVEQVRETHKTRKLGWNVDKKGQTDSFIYGGVTFHRDGREGPAAYIDTKLKRLYTPTGAIEPWKAAAEFVLKQNVQQLNVFLAAGFGAPLVHFTGQDIGLLSLHGASGAGKSTVLKVTAAIWGHPKDSRVSKSSTENSVGHKMGTLAHLPVLWDEVSEENDQLVLFKVVMQDGQQKGRLQSRMNMPLEARDEGNWSTLILSCSNPSMVEYLATLQRDTNAGRYRVFEMRAVTDMEVTGSHWDANSIIEELSYNFGHAGLIYSKFLASKSADLKQMIIARGKEFDKHVHTRKEERYWSIFCAVTLLGAEFARDLGLVAFDVPAMEKFLIKNFLELRDRMANANNEGIDAAQELFTAFVKEHSQAMLVTDGFPDGKGGKSIVNMLKHPNPQYAKGVYVQWVACKVHPRVLIDRNEFTTWLQRKQRQPSSVFEFIPHTVERATLGRGTPYASGRERVMVIQIKPGSWLDQTMRDIYGGEPMVDGAPKVQELPLKAQAPLPPKVTPMATSAEQGILASAAIATAKDDLNA